MLEIVTTKGNIVIPKEALPLIWYGSQKKQIFNVYKEYLSRFLIKDGNGVIVDWKERQKVINTCSDYQMEGVEQYTNSVLIALGVLSFNEDQVFSFHDRNLNPIWGMPDVGYHPCYFPGRIGEAYFKKKSDIIGYSECIGLKNQEVTISFLTKKQRAEILI